ncbi:MAG: SRPBCC domain-containing protein [Pseudomonadota bacterium]
MNTTISKSAFFKVPRETVWAFLTEGEKLGQWFFAPEADLVAGQDYVMSQPGETGDEAVRCWGRVLEMEPPSKLVYSFTIKPMNGVMSKVTWILEEVLGGTRLTLEHTGLGQTGEAALGLLAALDGGWDRHIGKLREVVS